jgi:hypothetical protein
MKAPAPDAQAVARRAIVLRHLAGFALSAPTRELLTTLQATWTPRERREFIADARADRERRLEELGPWKRWLTRDERVVFEKTADKLSAGEQINASWRTEAVHVLAWALRLQPRLLPYDRQASLEKHGLKKHGELGADLVAFVRAARLRTRKEIEAARELAEFWHWRSRTRQLHEGGSPPSASMRAKGIETYDDIVRAAVRAARRRGELRTTRGDDFSAMGKAYRDLTDDEWSDVRSITVERHFALNWLCGMAPRNRWDETPTDT